MATKKTAKRKYVRRKPLKYSGTGPTARMTGKGYGTDTVPRVTDEPGLRKAMRDTIVNAGNREEDRSGTCLTPSERNRVLDGEQYDDTAMRKHYDERINAANNIELPYVARELVERLALALKESQRLYNELRSHRSQNHRLMHEVTIHRNYMQVIRSLQLNGHGDAATPASDGPF